MRHPSVPRLFASTSFTSARPDKGHRPGEIYSLGIGNTGTTALLFEVAGGLPHCAAFSRGKPGRDVGDYQNAVYKHTYNERKGKTFDLFRDHFAREPYDRYIWTARDPRDAAISRMLYRWLQSLLNLRSSGPTTGTLPPGTKP
jgi:hypothetical protein